MIEYGEWQWYNQEGIIGMTMTTYRFDPVDMEQMRLLGQLAPGQRKQNEHTTGRRRQTNNRNRPVQGSQYSDDGARIYKFRRIGLSIRGDTGLNDSARVADFPTPENTIIFL